MKKKKTEKLPYDPTPMTNAFPGQPEDCFDLINQYGTYEIQRTADTDNEFPAIAQGLAKTGSGERNKKRGRL